MASVHAVADYILWKSLESTGESITSSKLQKLVHQCQALSVALNDSPLFHEQVQCFASGSVVMSLHLRFACYGKCPIDRCEIRGDPRCELSDSERAVIEQVWARCGSLSEGQLRNINYHEALWRA